MSSDSIKNISRGLEHFMKFVPPGAKMNITIGLPPCPAARASHCRCRSKARASSSSKSIHKARSVIHGDEKKLTKTHKEKQTGSEISVNMSDSVRNKYEQLKRKQNEERKKLKALKLKAKEKSDRSLSSAKSSNSCHSHLKVDRKYSDPFFPPATLIKGSYEKCENQKAGKK